MRKLIIIAFGMLAADASCALFTNDNVERLADSAEVLRYKGELAVCRAEGKEAGSYAVYEACAHEIDIKEGLVDGGK